MRFGMVLSEEGVPLHDPVWEVFTPEAEGFESAGRFKVHLGDGAVGGLDNSPPDCKRHFEYNRKELAVAAVRSPELFVELAQKVKALKDQVEVLGKENMRLVEVLNCELEANRNLRESIDKLVALFEGDCAAYPGEISI